MAISGKPKFLLYSRWGEQLGELPVISATHRQEINSTDELDLTLTQPLAKGDRVLWFDGEQWFEHVADEESQTHDGGETFETVCQSSLMIDLDLAHVSLWVANDVSMSQAISTVLQLTTWTAGTVEDLGTQSIKLQTMSAYEALCEIAGTWGAEFRPVLTLDDYAVAERKVELVEHYGRDIGTRFEYGYSMDGVTKKILSDKVITACYGYGAQLDTETDGVKDRLKVYVEDNDAKQYWGLPDGKGGVMHAVGMYENSECEDSTQLTSETSTYLSQHSTPAVGYETSMPFASLRGARVGDTVQVIDTDFTPELRLEARIGSLTRDILSGETSSATFGTVTSVLPDVLARVYTVSTAAVTAAQSVSAASIMSGMNSLSTSGGANVCQTSDGGIITGNVALDATGNPTVTTGDLYAVRMYAGKLMQATSVDSTGRWIWQDVTLNTTQ